MWGPQGWSFCEVGISSAGGVGSQALPWDLQQPCPISVPHFFSVVTTGTLISESLKMGVDFVMRGWLSSIIQVILNTSSI